MYKDNALSKGAIQMKPQLEVYPRLATLLEKITSGCLYALVAFVPLLFFPLATNALDFHKQTFLLIVTSIGFIAWLGQAVCRRVFRVSLSWLDLGALLFLGGCVLSSLFSQDRYVSFVGGSDQVEWAYVSLVAYVLFYFLLVNDTLTKKTIQSFVGVFLGSSMLVGGFGLFHLFGWLTPNTFNTIGTVNSLGVYMALPLILSTGFLTLWSVSEDPNIRTQRIFKSILWGSWFTSLVVALVVDYWAVWAIVLCGSILLLGLLRMALPRLSGSVRMALVLIVMTLSACLLIFRLPFHVQIPIEVYPSASASWNITWQTLQRHPLLGSGPGTWSIDYAQFRQAAVNLTAFWTTRFERGLSVILTLPATIGLIGSVLWLALVSSVSVSAWLGMKREQESAELRLRIPIFVAWVSVLCTAALYNYTVSSQVAFWFLLALLTAHHSRRIVTWDMRTSVGSSACMTVLFLVGLIGLISGTWLVGQRWIADVYYARAGQQFQSGASIQVSIDTLEKVIRLNPFNDAYQRDASQAYLLRAKQELAGPANADRTNRVNDTIAKALRYAARAVEMSSANVDNWVNSAVILQTIAPLAQGADEQAIKMFQHAAEREPNNPAFITEIGKIHILRSDAYRQLMQAKDEKTHQDAEKQMNQELEQAAGAFQQAIQMKADYAVAHYHLGLVYERQGRLKDAIAKLEQVIRSDSKNMGVAFQLALLYLRNGDKAKALNILEQLVAFDPSYSNARWYLSSLYEEAHRYDDAIAQVQKIKETNPDNDDVNKRLAALILLRNLNSKPVMGPLLEPVQEDARVPTAKPVSSH